MTVASSSSVKLQTPIERMWPASRATFMPSKLSTYLPSFGAGQWIR